MEAASQLRVTSVEGKPWMRYLPDAHDNLEEEIERDAVATVAKAAAQAALVLPAPQTGVVLWLHPWWRTRRKRLPPPNRRSRRALAARSLAGNARCHRVALLGP